MGRYLRSAAVLWTIALVISACGADSEDTGEVYKLGAVLSLSGAAADLGEHSRDGVNVAVSRINEAGGVNGRQLEVEFLDDQTDPNRAVAHLNALAGDPEVLAVIGGTLGTATLAMAPVAQEHGVPMFATNTTYGITRLDNPYIFRTAPPAPTEIEATEEMAAQLGLERLVLLHSTDAYASQAADLFAESNLNIVGVQSFAPEDTDVTAQLTVLRGQEPDGLLVWSISPATGIAIRNAGELGMTNIPILSGQGSNNPGNIEAASGSPALDNWLVQGVVDGNQPLPRQEEGVAAMSEVVDYPLDIFISGPYDAVNMIAMALADAGDDVTREDLLGLLETVHYSGVSGDYRYFPGSSPEARDGVGPDAIIWLEVIDGGFSRFDVP